MSSDNPPYPYYNGIPFNPSFFTSDTGTSSGGLTEAEANTKYLLKTTPDIATALETFNAGIVTPSLSSTGNLSISVPAALSTDVLNVGIVNRTIAGQVHHYSDGNNCVAGAGVHINNGINNNSATNISNGDGDALGSAAGAVNIKTGFNNTGTIAIGKYTSATNQTTTTISGATNISTTGGIVNIATLASRTTDINIGSGNNSGLGSNININTGVASAGQVSINSGFNSTAPTLIGNSESNTTQQCNIQSGQIFIGAVAPTTNARNITIGATSGAFDSNTALNGITTISKPSISTPLTPLYSYPITTTSQIGYISTPTITWSQAQNGVMATTPSLPIGLYLINWCITVNGTNISNFVYLGSSTFSGALDSFRGPFINAATNANVSNSTLVFNSTVARTYILNNFNANTQALNGTPSFSVTRIA